jgi:hypothetical protein
MQAQHRPDLVAGLRWMPHTGRDPWHSRGTGSPGGLRRPAPGREQEVVDRLTRELDLVAGALDDRPKSADPLSKVVADGVEPRRRPSLGDTGGAACFVLGRCVLPSGRLCTWRRCC